MMARKVGELTLERDFAVEKLQRSVSCSDRKTLVENEHKLSLNKQLKVLGLSKTAHYYKPVEKFSSDENISSILLIIKFMANPSYNTFALLYKVSSFIDHKYSYNCKRTYNYRC